MPHLNAWGGHVMEPKMEQMYRGVRETERSRIAFVIVVRMLYICRRASCETHMDLLRAVTL